MIDAVSSVCNKTYKTGNQLTQWTQSKSDYIFK